MHNTSQSESAILRSLLETTAVEKANLKDKLDGVLADLDVECDISKDRTWADTYYCGIHGTHYKDKKETYICPVGSFAKELKNRHG